MTSTVLANKNKVLGDNTGMTNHKQGNRERKTTHKREKNNKERKKQHIFDHQRFLKTQKSPKRQTKGCG